MKTERPHEGGNPATGQGQTGFYPASPTEVDELLGIAHDYRRAARLIADDESLTIRSKCLGLLELNRRARRDVLPEFAAAADWGGCRFLFDEDRGVPQNVIEANRRLLRRGQTDCPTCRRPLPTHARLDDWEHLGRRSMIRRGAA